MKLINVSVLAVLLAVASSKSAHCPDNCVPALAGICDEVEGILEKVPVVEKVPFVKDLVGKSICFPEDKKPVPNTLCPAQCGKTAKAQELFGRVCNYVDDILQSTPGVPKNIRNLTDFAICVLADLIPLEGELDQLEVSAATEGHDSHCPGNCMEGMVDLCDKVEGILENVPVVQGIPFVLDIVGKAMCFPEDTKPNANSLCPKDCAKSPTQDSEKIFTRVCNYVDNILQSTPGVSPEVREMTDKAICAIGALIPDEQAQVEVASSFCPDNCDEKLKKVCEFVEGIVTEIPGIKDTVDKEIGRAICFPATAEPHADSFCVKDCGDEMNQKVCEYVDLLMQVPQVPSFARNLTATVICKIGSAFEKELAAVKPASFLRNTFK